MGLVNKSDSWAQKPFLRGRELFKELKNEQKLSSRVGNFIKASVLVAIGSIPFGVSRLHNYIKTKRVKDITSDAGNKKMKAIFSQNIGKGLSGSLPQIKHTIQTPLRKTASLPNLSQSIVIDTIRSQTGLPPKIQTALPIVPPRSTIQPMLTPVPTGFPQYGNSCWVASAMQCLLACDNFENVVRSELEKARHDQNPQIQKKVEMLEALISIFEAYKRGDPLQSKERLLKLHRLLCENVDIPGGIPIPGKMATPSVWVNALNELISPVFNSWLNIDEVRRLQSIGFPAAFNDKVNTAEILSMRAGREAYDVDQILTVNGRKYRLVGVSEVIGNHQTAFVRRGDKWFNCNDGRHDEVSKDRLTSSPSHLLVFQHIEE